MYHGEDSWPGEGTREAMRESVNDFLASQRKVIEEERKKIK